MAKSVRNDNRDLSTDTASRVVRAARAGFAIHGYGGASMRAIAADVGVTAMALYTYAPSKAALLQLVYDETMLEVYGSFSDAVADRRSLFDELNAIVERAGHLLEKDPELLHFMIRVILDRHQDGLDDFELVSEPIVKFYEGLVARAVARKELPRRDGTRLVRFVTMLLWGIIAAAAADPTGVKDAVDTAKWAAAASLGA